MTREIDLVSYLPPFLAEFKEIAVTLEAENPEFVLVWNAAERVLKMNLLKRLTNTGFHDLKSCCTFSLQRKILLKAAVQGFK